MERKMPGSVNKVILVGNLGKDPETRNFQDGGKVVTFSVATSEAWTDKQSGERKEKTQWTNVSIFNDALAEIAERYLKKGAKVYVEGQLETRSWDKDGSTHYATDVVLRPFNGTLTMLDKAPAPERPAEPPTQSRRTARREPSGRS
jgi:single-strand DNA-binding protein